MPLKIRLRPSWRLTAVLVIAHGIAIALVAIVDIPIWIGFVAGTALVLSCVSAVRRNALLLAPSSAIGIEIGSDHVLTVQARRGSRSVCEVLPSTFVAAYLTVLNLREIERGAVRHVIVLPDGIDAGDFRSLRTWLRWKPTLKPG